MGGPGQNILVFVYPDGHPEIAEGNHRLTAALLAELPAVSVEVYYKGGSDEHHQIWPFDPDDPRIRVVED